MKLQKSFICLLSVFFLYSASVPNFSFARVSKSKNDRYRAMAEEEHIPGQIMVKLKRDVRPRQVFGKVRIASYKKTHQKLERGLLISEIYLKKRETNRLYLVRLSDNSKAAMIEALEVLNKSSLVEYAEPDGIVRFDLSSAQFQNCTAPNDELYAQQWSLPKTEADKAECNIGRDASAVVAAVIDTGVNYAHPDLADTIWVNPGEDIDGDGIITDVDRNGVDDDMNGIIDDFHGFNARDDEEPGDPEDGNNHGTHVSGIIGAETNNNIGIASPNDGPIMALKFLNEFGSGSTSDAIECIEYANAMSELYGFNIVFNASWGGRTRKQALYDALYDTRQSGNIFITSAGNAFSSNPRWPAAFSVELDNVIAVAATNEKDEKAPYSSYGSFVNIAAPGDHILSTIREGYGHKSGTSMAAPLVVSAVRKVWSDMLGVGNRVEYQEVLEKILDSAEPISALQKYIPGGTRLNFANATNYQDTIKPRSITLKVIALSAHYAELSWINEGDEDENGALVNVLRYDGRISKESPDDIIYKMPIPGDIGAEETLMILDLQPDTSYLVSVQVIDKAGNRSEISDIRFRTLGFTISHDFNFNEDDGGWTHYANDPASSDDWEYGETPKGPAGNQPRLPVWTTKLIGPYSNDLHASLVSPPISLEGLQSPQMDTSFWWALDPGEGDDPPYDGVIIELSQDNGQSWERLDPNSGYPFQQVHESCPLYPGPAYSGFSESIYQYSLASFDLSAHENQTVLIRFRAGSSMLSLVASAGVIVQRIIIGGTTHSS